MTLHLLPVKTEAAGWAATLLTRPVWAGHKFWFIQSTLESVFQAVISGLEDEQMDTSEDGTGQPQGTAPLMRARAPLTPTARKLNARAHSLRLWSDESERARQNNQGWTSIATSCAMGFEWHSVLS